MMCRSDDRPVVILVGPEDKEHVALAQMGLAPRLDYRLVAERLNGGRVHEMRLSSARLAGTKAVRVLRSQSANLAAALRLLRTLPEDAVVYATAEVWGLPISLAAAMRRQRQQTVIWKVHQVWSRPWRLLLGLLSPVLPVHGWICHTPHQARLLRQMLGEQALIAFIPYGIDTHFFAPDRSWVATQPPYILAVGAEERNYPLLLQAVARLDLPVIIQVSSIWTTAREIQEGLIPANVRLQTRRISYVDLRALYAGAAVVAVSINDTPIAAGINNVLEAMAMGKAIVATRSHALPEVLADGVTGRIVEPEAGALAAALTADSQREAMAARAYAAINATCTLEMYATKLAEFICQVAAQHNPETIVHAHNA